MSSTSGDSDGHLPAPFLVNLIYRTGAFQRPNEIIPNSLPPHISIYTWSSCTLSELAMELAATRPSALPYPAVGTRLAFQLVYPDLRGPALVNDASSQYAVKDLGSVVIGQGGPGVETSVLGDPGGAWRGEQEAGRTLGDARFIVGDLLSCAILPPRADGSVAPASNARRDASFSVRDARGQREGFVGREDSLARGGARGVRGGRGGFPMGEWRRGEALPDASHAKPRGGGSRW